MASMDESAKKNLFIGNPTKFRQFRNGEIGQHYDSVYIEAGAHPNLLSEVSHFTNATNRMIRFRDVDYKRNIINLYPVDKKVRCVFQIGVNSTVGLPRDFECYHIDFGLAGIACMEDIDTILAWKNCKELRIFDQCNIVYKLYQRIDEFKQLTNLEVLHLRIDEKNSEEIQLKTFFGIFPKLQRIEFECCNVEEGKLEAFLDKEKLWTIEEFERIKSRDYAAAYVRKGALEKYRAPKYVIA